MGVTNRSLCSRKDKGRFAATALALGAMLLSGCGEDEPKLPQEGALFEYTRSGGLAFSVIDVTIDADGTGTVESTTSAEPADVAEFKLTDTELDELRTILEENPISSLSDPGDAVCADCFEYTYAYGGGEITISDVSEPIPELDELDAFLAELSLPEDEPNGG
jgi:hypothetical protein